MEIRKHVLFSTEAKQHISEWIRNDLEAYHGMKMAGEITEEEECQLMMLVFEIEASLKMMGVLDYE